LVEIRTLRNFLQTASIGSVSRAALKLRMAQPALSRQIRQLEADLGAPLFVRNGRGLALTEVGKELYDKLVIIIRDLDIALATPRNREANVSGEVRLGILWSLGSSFYTNLILECERLFPQLKLAVLTGDSSQVAGWIHGRNIDFGFMYDVQSYGNLHVEFSFEEHAVFVGRTEDWQFGDTISFAELARFPIMVTATSNLTRRKLEKASCDSGIPLQIKREVDSFPLIERLISLGEGYSVFTPSFIWDSVAEGTMRAALIKDPVIQFKLSVVTGPGMPLSGATCQVMNLVRSMMTSYCEKGRWSASS
jgi:LysR family transcriptional regulator, nitrogen assimilation regulatory protein